MGLADHLGIALKEWASVCRALEEGRQIVLLRKGGISEDAGRFELENPQFLLFPTYLHQNLQMLKATEHEGFVAASEEPAWIAISAAAEVAEIERLESRKQMDRLFDEHIWTEPLIDMRFNYKPQNPLYLMMVRVYRLPEALTIRNTRAYAGCKSWVPLDQAIATSGAAPVLPEEEFDERTARIKRLLK